MTLKEIEQIPWEIREKLATHLRLMADLKSQCYRTVEVFADELNPPRPEPGTVVWWRWTNRKREREWSIGQVAGNRKGVYVDIYSCKVAEWDHIEYNPARILGPDEVAVKVPPVKTWGGIAELHVQVRSPQGGVTFSDLTITRVEAERMELGR